MQSRGKITGLTSAATIWVVAAIGITVGAGLYLEAIGAGALVALVLGGLGKLEHHARRARRNVRIVIRTAPLMPEETIVDLIEGQGIRITRTAIFDHKEDRVFEMRLVGPARQYDVLRQALSRRDDVFSSHVY